MRRFILWIFLIVVMELAALPVHGQALVQDDTLVLMNFDGSIQPEFCKGTRSIELKKGELVPQGGRFGDGLLLVHSGMLELIGNDGNLNPAEGTVEFWIKPTWPGNDESKRSLFSARVADQEYLNINTLGMGRLGIAMAAGNGDDFRWRRADGDASDWEVNTWHHVAFAWGNGVLSVFLDGKQDTDNVTDSLMLRGLPEKLTLIGADAVIDDVHIHRRRFAANDVARAIDAALNPPMKMLDTFVYGESSNVEDGGMTILGDVIIPLVLSDRLYSRGFAMGNKGYLTFPHDGSSQQLCAVVGVSTFATADVDCSFEVWGDDQRLFVSDAVDRGDGPLEIRVDVTERKEIWLKVAGNNMRHREAIWAYPRLTSVDQSVPMESPPRLTAKRIDMYHRQLAADEFSCEILSNGAWCVSAKHWADEVEAQTPKILPEAASLQVAAAPGEYEPVNFSIYAINSSLSDVCVSVSDLKNDIAVIPADACNVRIALRRLMRDLYTLPPDRSTVVSRFLLPNQAVDIPAGTFREYHVIVHVPRNQAPGRYLGTVSIRAGKDEKRSIPLAVDVRPIVLGPPTPNVYGMYYRFPADETEWNGLERELVDIYEYGGRMLKSNLSVGYALTDDGTVVADVGRVRRGLTMLAKLGYAGPMPIGTGAETLARILKYDPVADHDDATPRNAFRSAIAEGMSVLEQLDSDFPQFEIMPTHMDEVFGHDRLPRYIRLTEAVKSVTDMRVYITLHNDPKRAAAPLLQQIDPYVDVRCFNGHVMDNWIQAGNSFADLESEMRGAGDEAWLYHNIRGSFFPAEWTRLVNGFYMWISPIKVHVPWMYYSYKMNPMDCTDGPERRGGDFAYAVPDPNDANAMIPTRHWEAYREGIDDMRYLRTLERLVERQAGSPQANRAKKWLAELRKRVTPSHEELQKIEIESPLLVWLASKFDGEDYRRFREEAGRLIAELQRGD